MGKSDGTMTTRYAPYIESRHAAFLFEAAKERTLLEYDNPYASFTDIQIEDAFFGSGFVISSFPSLYDMFGKFMAGLDIDYLFDQIFEDTINGAVIDNLVSAEADRLSDDIEQEAAPRFEAGMRDMNAVMSSSFVVGRGLMETARTKAIARYDSEVRFKMLPVATERWTKHLEWNKEVTSTYANILKFYISSKLDVNSHNFDLEFKKKIWYFTVLGYEGAALGIMQGAKTETQSKPLGQQILGTALSIAGAAAMF